MRHVGRQYEQQRYDTWQAQQEALAEQRRQAAAARSASAADSSWLGALGGGGGGGAAPGNAGDPARDEVVSVIGNRDYAQLQRYYNALKSSAGYGNTTDARKLEYLQALQPGLFKNGQLNTARLNALIQQSKPAPKAAPKPAPRPTNKTIGGQTFGLYR